MDAANHYVDNTDLSQALMNSAHHYVDHNDLSHSGPQGLRQSLCRSHISLSFRLLSVNTTLCGVPTSKIEPKRTWKKQTEEESVKVGL